MARFRLQDTDDWTLVHDDQDVRGWRVIDAAGRDVGTVEDMVVDDVEKRVDAFVLDDGREVRAADTYLGDDAVYLESTAGARALTDVHTDYGRVQRGV